MWKKVKNKGGFFPSPRNCVSMEACPHLNSLILFGGVGMSMKDKFGDTYFYDTKEKKWIQVEVNGDIPTPRYYCTMNRFQRNMVLFGGFDGDRLNTVHFFNPDTLKWEFKVTNGEIPEKRSHHTASILGNRLIIFGGLSQEGKRLSDLHVLDLSTLTWFQPELKGQEPSPRLGHVSAVLGNNVFVIFGGYGGPEGHTKFNEINLLHLDTMVWSQPHVTGTCPPGMYAHTSAAIGDKLIVYGGDIGAPTRLLSSDLYIFDLSTLHWTKVETYGDIPPPRSHLGSAILNNKFYIFGGSGKGEQEKLNDMYYLDLSSIDLLRNIPFEEMEETINTSIESIILECENLAQSIIENYNEKDLKKKVSKLLAENVHQPMEDMRNEVEDLINKRENFDKWKKEQIQMLHNKGLSNHGGGQPTYPIKTNNGRLTLNIGGVKYETTLSTITKYEKSLLGNMFSGKHKLHQCEDGSYFIDRDGTNFRYILNYLRDSNIFIPPNKSLYLYLLREAQFYNLDELVEILIKGLKQLEQELNPNNLAAEEERRKGKSKI